MIELTAARCPQHVENPVTMSILGNCRQGEFGRVGVRGVGVIESSRFIRMEILNSYKQWFVPLYKHASMFGILTMYC